jgi:transitional endoplasmic reticulum ATPase
MDEKDLVDAVAHVKKILKDAGYDPVREFAWGWGILRPSLPVPQLNADGELMTAAVVPQSKDVKPVVHLAEVVKHGEKIIIPETLGYKDASDILLRKLEEEEQVVSFHETIPCFPLEGALGLHAVLNDMFGAALQEASRSFFGDAPPQMLTIETGPDTKVSAPWGNFAFPLDKGTTITCGAHPHDGRFCLCISGKTKKKWMPTILEIASRVKQYVKEHSIYRGKALRMTFASGHYGEPSFMDLRGVKVDEVVYNKDLTGLIETNILTPIIHAQACRDANIPLKRGVLAAGPYGTGKSLLARAVARIGTDNGWTFIYIKDASQLADAIRFAQAYQPAIIFAEDVDRHMSGGRTDEMDNILNTLDGIDSKTSELMVILTTNHLDQINQAMLRPGRLDVILNIVAPDAEAVQRLIKLYARGRLDETSDLVEAGELLAGFTPAVVREVVERAKLASITRTGKADSWLIGEDIAVSARTMVQQQNLLKKPEEPKPDWSTQMAKEIAGVAVEKLKANGLGTMEERIGQIHGAVT